MLLRLLRRLVRALALMRSLIMKLMMASQSQWRESRIQFEHVECEFKEESRAFNYYHERMIRMLIAALRESIAVVNTHNAAPLVLTVPADQLQEKTYTPYI